MQSVLAIFPVSSHPADTPSVGKPDPSAAEMPSFGESFTAPDSEAEPVAGFGDVCVPVAPLVVWTGAAMSVAPVCMGRADGNPLAGAEGNTADAGLFECGVAGQIGAITAPVPPEIAAAGDSGKAIIPDAGKQDPALPEAEGNEVVAKTDAHALPWRQLAGPGAFAEMKAGEAATPGLQNVSDALLPMIENAASVVDADGTGRDAATAVGTAPVVRATLDLDRVAARATTSPELTLRGTDGKISPRRGSGTDLSPLAMSDPSVRPFQPEAVDESATGSSTLHAVAHGTARRIEVQDSWPPTAIGRQSDPGAAPGEASVSTGKVVPLPAHHAAEKAAPSPVEPQTRLQVSQSGQSSAAPVEPVRPLPASDVSEILSGPADPAALMAYPQAKSPGFWERFFTGQHQPIAADAARQTVGSTIPVVPMAGMMAGTVPQASSAAPRPATMDEFRRTGSPDHLRRVVGLPEAASPPVVVGPEATASDPSGMQKQTGDAIPTDKGFLNGDPLNQLDAASLLSVFASGAPLPGSFQTGPGQIAAGLPVPQIAQQITGALSRSPDGVTELALSPDELGHVRLRLEPDAANPDRMVVMITFERPETLDLFRRHAGDLAEALRAAGYSGADIGFGQESGAGFGSDRREASADPSNATTPGTPSPDPVEPAPRPMAGASLDLRL